MTPWLSMPEPERLQLGDDAASPFGGGDAAESEHPGTGSPPVRLALIKLAIAKWLFSLKENRPFPEFRGNAGEPGWDLLLDLYIRELAGRRTSVTSACIGSRAPPTTALRYVNTLCDTGRIERHRDETDARRYWLELAPDVSEEIERYMKGVIDDFLDILKARF